MSFSVTKESPVNVCHPDFGALGNGSVTNEDVAINKAIAYAKTAGRNTGPSEVFVPSGYYKTTARLNIGNCTGLHIYGEGVNSVIEQQTNNEPIIESNSTIYQNGIKVEDLALYYATQQIQASHPNSAAIRLRNTDINGFYRSTFRGLRVHQPCYILQWGDTATCAFWNNLVEMVFATSVSSALVKNSSPSAIGSPTNWCNRLSHTGGSVTPAGSNAALDLAVSDWEFASLDVEDWTDRVMYATGGSHIGVNGCHLERHHLVTSNGAVFYLVQCSIDVARVDGSYYRDHTGGAYIFAIGRGGTANGEGYVGSIVTNTYGSGNLGTGTIANFLANDVNGRYMIGPRNTNDTVNVNDLQFPFETGAAFASVDGLPPTILSNVALPAASATTRGRQYRVVGANATTADTLVECMQSATGTFSWKVIATG
jgi:hypothetical protein